MPTPAELLTQSLVKFRTANRIDGTRASYRKDNPGEYVSVMAYLDGGPRPTNVTSDMGMGLLLEEDARRALGVIEPPPPGFTVPTKQVSSSPTDGSVFNQSWLLYTSPTTPTGSWGGTPVREFRTPPLSGGSWEWWCLYELFIPSSWSVSNEGSMYALGLDAHNVPGDVGWDDGTSGVSSIHYKFKGGALQLQHERQADSGSGPNIFTVYPSLPRDQWHSIAFRHVLGRLDGLVPAAGHPNAGKGRSWCWVNGAQRLDTGDINILHRNGSKVQQRMTLLHGIYNPNMGAAHTARLTALRVGRTLAEALGDSQQSESQNSGNSETGAHTWSAVTPRSSSDFIAPSGGV